MEFVYFSGSIVLQVLGILERFKLNRNTVENIHILVEALKHGYASRSLLGDPVPPFKVRKAVFYALGDSRSIREKNRLRRHG